MTDVQLLVMKDGRQVGTIRQLSDRGPWKARLMHEGKPLGGQEFGRPHFPE